MNAQAAAATASSASQVAGSSAVEVGHIFAGGGTDGLILYALVLSDFLMFLALVATLIITSRTTNVLSKNCHDEGVEFASASKDAAGALRELAQSISSKAAGDAAHQAAISALMGQMLSEKARERER